MWLESPDHLDPVNQIANRAYIAAKMDDTSKFSQQIFHSYQGRQIYVVHPQTLPLAKKSSYEHNASYFMQGVGAKD